MLTRLLARVVAGIPEPLAVRPADVEDWFGVSDRTAREWLGEWANANFMAAVASGQGVRIREYQLAEPWASFLMETKSVPENSGSE